MNRKPEKSTQVFHGCCRKNADGTSRIIEKGKRCLTPTSYPFWKRIPDISTSTIRTRSHKQKQKIASRGEYNRYLRQNGRIKHKKMARGRRLRRLCYERMRHFFC